MCTDPNPKRSVCVCVCVCVHLCNYAKAAKRQQIAAFKNMVTLYLKPLCMMQK